VEEINEAVKTQQEARLSEGSIRVDVGLLDKLMNQVGELVLARNQILQFADSLNDPAFLGTSQRLNLITTELQEVVMKTRMQPIGNIWSKFPRIVRDLALQCGKKVRIESEGKETELDKTIVEAIKDPLTHLVRNAVDHGIESPEARLAAGKPEEGCLFLRAFHEGGQVNIEVTDDGGGLNHERIRQRAVERGLISREQATRMSDRDATTLIFAPGFSTAAQVTNVSGRGVGMDVVKTNIDKIGGTVDLQSQLGRGTTVKIKIPLTLAIIPALIITCGGDRDAIPQVKRSN
jgi:two-component system chemotaxis sensor kinase CheA